MSDAFQKRSRRDRRTITGGRVWKNENAEGNAIAALFHRDAKRETFSQYSILVFSKANGRSPSPHGKPWVCPPVSCPLPFPRSGLIGRVFHGGSLRACTRFEAHALLINAAIKFRIIVPWLVVDYDYIGRE